jgi:hypothetical protein
MLILKVTLCFPIAVLQILHLLLCTFRSATPTLALYLLLCISSLHLLLTAEHHAAADERGMQVYKEP